MKDRDAFATLSAGYRSSSDRPSAFRSQPSGERSGPDSNISGPPIDHR